ADFDNDGDIDFVLAMFGWRDTGQIGLLRQLDSGEFELEEIYVINGAMRVLTNDVNEDGRPDFVALITQQHEAIMQFTNEGNGKFSDSLISRANHPAFGSSGIQLADLDRDGDEDILYTNGDMMDENPEPKPYHGAQWFENLGGAKYAVHHLVAMPGCYGSQIVDFDRDGDLDLVLSALYFQWKDHDFPSLIWLENLGGFRDFTRRRIAYAPTNLANIAVADFNNDGLLDIAGGGMHVPGPLDRKGRVTLWIQGREVAEKDQ
ncbi:MAG: VCBS repeat-containing protein, partial [Verrucomicrobiota bacterium]